MVGGNRMTAPRGASNGVLLDTCAVIWLAFGQSISKQAREAIREASEGLFVSPMSAWEVGQLTRSGRSLMRSARDWFASVLELPGVTLSPLTATMLLDSHELPGDPPRDPTDRIIIATARAIGVPIVTRDERMITYCRRGHAGVVVC
jgi:PIN domain nuclease of toxin-antitoxin system